MLAIYFEFAHWSLLLPKIRLKIQTQQIFCDETIWKCWCWISMDASICTAVLAVLHFDFCSFISFFENENHIFLLLESNLIHRVKCLFVVFSLYLFPCITFLTQKKQKMLRIFWQTFCCFSTFRTKSILALLHHENINNKSLELRINTFNTLWESLYIETHRAQ